jgi:hypothetical protein
MPKHFTWNVSQKKWKRREKGTTIKRMHLVGSSGDKQYFAQTLLTVVKGPTSFENLRTIDKRIYDTFKAACVTHSLYDRDEEWD